MVVSNLFDLPIAPRPVDGVTNVKIEGQDERALRLPRRRPRPARARWRLWVGSSKGTGVLERLLEDAARR